MNLVFIHVNHFTLNPKSRKTIDIALTQIVLCSLQLLNFRPYSSEKILAHDSYIKRKKFPDTESLVITW